MFDTNRFFEKLHVGSIRITNQDVTPFSSSEIVISVRKVFITLSHFFLCARIKHSLVGLRYETQQIIECHERLVLGFTYVQTNLLDFNY
jgi:hypothetical protein